MTNKYALLILLTICLTAAAGSVFGQKQLKSWKEWSKKDAE